MLSQKIIHWYLENKRDLPWRNTKNPYYIWLSEVILQQTRVDQGLPYYLKFVALFPFVEDLAKAEQSEVLRAWQGLGYYSRARNLQTAAQYIVDELNGEFPTSYKTLLKMKGVGVYTAAAIASIAYNEPKAVVDGNVYRVLSRLFEISEPINSTSGVKVFAILANELLDANNPADFNQGMMELGATICRPKNPECNNCPVSLNCGARKNKRQLDFPVKLKKIKVRSRHFNYLVLCKDETYFLAQRAGKDIWQGLFEFYLIETSENIEDFELLKSELPEWLTADFTIGVSSKKTQVLSHQKIHATFWPIFISENQKMGTECFYPLQKIEDLPKHRLIEKYYTESLLQ